MCIELWKALRAGERRQMASPQIMWIYFLLHFFVCVCVSVCQVQLLNAAVAVTTLCLVANEKLSSYVKNGVRE
jgi:hypothetical protein